MCVFIIAGDNMHIYAYMLTWRCNKALFNPTWTCFAFLLLTNKIIVFECLNNLNIIIYLKIIYFYMELSSELCVWMDEPHPIPISNETLNTRSVIRDTTLHTHFSIIYFRFLFFLSNHTDAGRQGGHKSPIDNAGSWNVWKRYI